jgi:Mg2+ and Co2+ transporter CorA
VCDADSVGVQEDMQEDLDRKRNALFALTLLITIITMAFASVSMITGIFGMNLNSYHQQSANWFVIVTSLSTGIAGFTVLILFAVLRQNRMLFLGSR